VGALGATETIQLNVVLPPRNEGQLQALLRGLYSPGSPDYHQWLRPGQFVEQFGPSGSQTDAVESWLHGVGLTDTGVSGFAVRVTAKASQVDEALGTSFEKYRTRSGHVGYLAQKTPLVPEALADGQVAAILGLDTVSTFQSQSTLSPATRQSPNVAQQPDADGLTPCSAAQSAAAPGYYTLDALGAAYGFGSLLSDGQNGHGKTIAVYELGSSSSSDVSTYENCFGLSNPVSAVSADGGGGAVGGGGTVEADADIEQAATQAPGASLISYEAPNTDAGAYDDWETIVTADAASVVSTSWGICEPFAVEDAEIPSYSTLFEQAATQGQTVLAASGDSGSEDCYQSDNSTALEVDYPASDPWVTGVGGTDLYGPGDEVAWPEGGGGISREFADPSWQPLDLAWQSSGNPCGLDCREVPDLSSNAGVGMIIYDSGAWTVIGGTSLAAPLVAGLVADRDDGCTTSTADLAPTLYAADAQGLYGSALTDITSGDNDYTDSYGGADYRATTGYDPVTGLGTPLAAGLSCPEVTAVTTGLVGTQVTISGLGLEHASISFGGAPAVVESATATSATVVVPAGSGSVTVHATSDLGTGTQTVPFVYSRAPSQGAPHFNTDNASEPIRGSGSDTTFFVMQKISDIYNAAGLYGCTLTTASGQTLIDGSTTPSPLPTGNGQGTGSAESQCQNGAADVSTTDDADNWNRVEATEGVNDVGSGAGQNQLCGSLATPNPVNFARSSKPSAGTSGCNEEELGYAKDSAPVVDFPTINPSSIGTSSFSNVAGTAYPNAAYNSINGGKVGPVSNGWLPGDDPQGSSYNGTALYSISNQGAQNQSVAYRMYCTAHTSSNAITDWGQLTNLGPDLEVNVTITSADLSGGATPGQVSIASSSGSVFPSSITSGATVSNPYNASPIPGSTTVSSNGGGTLTLSHDPTATGNYALIFNIGTTLTSGNGVPVGIPIRIMGVNTASGTEYTFSQFAQGQTPGTGGCPDGSGAIGMNANAGNDPNASTASGSNPYHSALENNAHQLELFSQSDFPSDPVDQAIEEATTLYFMSFGVYNTNSYVGETTISGTNYAANLIAENNVFPGTTAELNDSFPTARTLSNIIDATAVTQSTGGFMNWVCDSDQNFQKGTDLNTGSNYDAEVGNLISTQYGFPRLTDLTGPVSATPADNTIAPNDDCVAKIDVTADGTDDNVTYVSGTEGQGGSDFPASIIPFSSYPVPKTGTQTAGTVAEITGPTGGVPSGTQVTSTGGGTTVTLNHTLPNGSYQLEFYGVPAVITASSSQ
jgi:hypothetical protein